MNDRRKVRSIRSAVALCSNVERCLGVFGITCEEQLEERVDVFARDRARVDCRSVARVRVSDVDGLVKEDDIGMRVPAVVVVGEAIAPVGDAARAQFE